MKAIQNTLLIVLLSIGLYSCASIEEPTIERIEDVDIVEMSKDKIDLNANMIINNPNGVALDLASANLEILVDNIVIANIQQTVDASMPANADFKLPVNIKMDLKKLYKENPMAALSKGLQIMSDRSLEVLFKGNIKAGKGVAKITVPVEQKEVVKF